MKTKQDFCACVSVCVCVYVDTQIYVQKKMYACDVICGANNCFRSGTLLETTVHRNVDKEKNV